MTHEEVIEALRLMNLKRSHPFLSWEETMEVRDIAIQAIEKQIPKKPMKIEKNSNPYYELKYSLCPNCSEAIDKYAIYDCVHKGIRTYCPRCGQAIDWSEEE